MPIKYNRYARRIDANSIKLVSNAGNTIVEVKESGAWHYLIGETLASQNLRIMAGNDYPFLDMYNAGVMQFALKNATDAVEVLHATTAKHYLNGNGVHFLAETTTPTAKANYGAIYTKNDNKLYFQDGAGTEYTVTMV